MSKWVNPVLKTIVVNSLKARRPLNEIREYRKNIKLGNDNDEKESKKGMENNLKEIIRVDPLVFGCGTQLNLHKR